MLPVLSEFDNQNPSDSISHSPQRNSGNHLQSSGDVEIQMHYRLSWVDVEFLIHVTLNTARNLTCIQNVGGVVHEEYKNLVIVIEGDVILSLDGNTGLVNNFLKGINGYGYKITSNKYENYQLYYSLLARINQNIIKQNSHGTTIMHATRAKEKILILDFFNNNILSIFYKLELNYKSQLKLINSNIELLIEKYII